MGLGTHPQPLARLGLLRVLDGGRAALQPGLGIGLGLGLGIGSGVGIGLGIGSG